MTLSLGFAFGWLVLANVTGMFPSKYKHWPQAYGLIAVGLPILGWVFWENGIGLALLVLIAACSVLRWPVRYLMRWLRRIASGESRAALERRSLCIWRKLKAA